MKKIRLSNLVAPYKYQITIKPDLEAFVFEGEETIILDLKKSVKSITLHSAELDIKSAEFISTPSSGLHSSTGRRVAARGEGNILQDVLAGKVSYNEKNETATIFFNKKLPAGQGIIKLTFRGVLNDKLVGFYKSKYKDLKGKYRHIATTQFEATDARRAFPCFDEPTQKAVFEVSLTVPKNLTAISNTLPIKIREHSGAYKTVDFAPTPKMSSYLLAMIVGDFEFLKAKTKSGVLVKVFATPGKKHQGKFALKTAVKMLEFYEDYFAVKYPLNTLDLIAIPDFGHGAMENWGAITYRETALLVDEEHSSAQARQRVALVIAHELAHQWFGNLVTMEWWTHLWLNEGFASFMEYLALDHVFPKWDVWTQFMYYDHGLALRLDGFKATHPIEINVHHPREISEIFDAISYSKGASVIRMLHDYLGEKDFRDGLRLYLKTHAYKNAATRHLWQALEKISGKPVGKIMNNWVKKEGYPLIKVKSQNSKLKISQQRFFMSPLSGQDKTIWHVPIKLKIENSKDLKILLNKKSAVINFPESFGWVKLNSSESGIYRCEYSPELMEKLVVPVKTKQLNSLDRLGIIRDGFASSFAGQAKISKVLNILEAYKNETDYTVWLKIIAGLGNITQLVSEKKYFPEFQNWAKGFLTPIYKKLGWAAKRNEPHTTGLLRGMILRQMAEYGNVEVIAKAKKLFWDYARGRAKIHPDLRAAIYSIAAENGSHKEMKALALLYEKAVLQEEERRLSSAMACFKLKALIRKTLEFSVSSKVRSQDTPLMLSSCGANPFAREESWRFVKKHWGKLAGAYAHNPTMMNYIIQPFWHFFTAQKRRELEAFFKQNKILGIGRTVSQVLEKIEANELWLKTNEKELKEYLKKRINRS